MPEQFDSVSIADAVKYFWRFRRLIVALAAVGALIGVGQAKYVAPKAVYQIRLESGARQSAVVADPKRLNSMMAADLIRPTVSRLFAAKMYSSLRDMSKDDAAAARALEFWSKFALDKFASRIPAGESLPSEDQQIVDGLAIFAQEDIAPTVKNPNGRLGAGVKMSFSVNDDGLWVGRLAVPVEGIGRATAKAEASALNAVIEDHNLREAQSRREALGADVVYARERLSQAQKSYVAARSGFEQQALRNRLDFFAIHPALLDASVSTASSIDPVLKLTTLGVEVEPNTTNELAQDALSRQFASLVNGRRLSTGEVDKLLQKIGEAQAQRSGIQTSFQAIENEYISAQRALATALAIQSGPLKSAEYAIAPVDTRDAAIAVQAQTGRLVELVVSGITGALLAVFILGIALSLIAAARWANLVVKRA